MAELLRVNGVTVRIDQIGREPINRTTGPPLLRLHTVTFVRGRIENLDFMKVFESGQAHVEMQSGPAYDMTITQAVRASTGEGMYAPIRYDITLEETPESAERRATEELQAASAAAAEAAAAEAAEAEARGDDLTRPIAPYPAPVSRRETTNTAGESKMWATALRQLRPEFAGPAEPAPPPPPLTVAELAGAEAVLAGLRVDALIEAFVAAKIIDREVVNYAFQRFIQQRFVIEATSIIGEDAARRILADLQQEEREEPTAPEA